MFYRVSLCSVFYEYTWAELPETDMMIMMK